VTTKFSGGFSSPTSRAQRSCAALAQLIAVVALIASITVLATTISLGSARAQDAAPSTGFAFTP
jgi:hypothetical protein